MSLFRLLLLAATVNFLFAQSPAMAHPGIGLVEDSRGNVYYTDLVHVWKVSPDGKKTIVVRNVHTHELGMDAQDNLYGEDQVYEGEAVNRWHHRIWKRSPDGRVTDVFGQRDGFREDYGFVRDRRGTQYWIHYEAGVGGATFIRKRTPDKKISTVYPQPSLPRLSWLAVSEDGATLYATATDGLYAISAQGTATRLLHGGTKQHAWMGIWPAPDGSVYVADYHSQTVNRVDSTGKATLVTRTEHSWSPSAVMRARNGALWLTEYSATNQVRLKRISPDGKTHLF